MSGRIADLPPWRASACEIVRRVRDGEWSCAEVMRSHLARCAKREPEVQAWEFLDAARAMACAEAADGRLRGGARAGPLAGLPLGVKDIIDVAGMPTRMGSPVTADSVATASARCVSRLEAAGAIVLGKTVTTEFAYYSPGKTRNPWNAAHTPGGSSSGSAAAVACGMVAGALGTQTNGSVVRPAAFCGVVGFKPSFGAVSNDGTLDPWPSLDHTGVLARKVGDAALLTSVIVEPAALVDAALQPIAAPALVAVRSPVWDLAEESQRRAYADGVARLRAAGASVVEHELPASFGLAQATIRTIMGYEAARHFVRFHAGRVDALSVPLRALIDEGRRVTDVVYRDALAIVRQLRGEFARFIDPFAAMLTPPAPGEAPATLAQTGNPAFCSIASLLGLPAITLPVALGPHGLPLGMQLVGRHRGDNALLSTAAWCEPQFGFTDLMEMEEE